MSTDDRYVFDVAEIHRVTDGDTYDLTLLEETAFYRKQLTRLIIRLDFADCPELRRGSAFERQEAKTATLVAEEWLRADGRRLKCRTRQPGPDTPPVGDGGYGRWLGDLWDDDTGQNLRSHLRSYGLASVWPTRWRDEFDAGAVA